MSYLNNYSSLIAFNLGFSENKSRFQNLFYKTEVIEKQSQTNVMLGNIVVEVDLDIVHPATGELADDKEESDGGYVALKRDDTTVMTNLKLHKASPSSVGGNYKLQFSNTKIKIWKNSDRTSAVVSDSTTFDTASDTTLYVEGSALSSSLRDVEVKLKLEVNNSSVCEDIVKFTVVSAEFDVQAKMWIREQWIDVPFHPIDNIFNNKIAGGDDRDGDLSPTAAFRVSQKVTIIPYKDLDLDGIKDGTNLNVPGLSSFYDRSSLPDPEGAEYSSTNRLPATAVPIETAVPDTSRMDVVGVARTNDFKSKVKFSGEANDPLIFWSCDIEWDIKIEIIVTDPLQPTYKITGGHDNYPSFEIDLEGTEPRFNGYLILHSLPSDVLLLCDDPISDFDVIIPSTAEGDIK